MDQSQHEASRIGASPPGAVSTSAPGAATGLSAAWQAGGRYFEWVSPLPENHGRKVKVFHTRAGGGEHKPAIVLVHGFPTSSIDFRPLFELLRDDFHLCALDFPGFGLSDKPVDGFVYSLSQDAQLLWDFISGVLGLQECTVFSHDRGDSVVLRFLQLYQAAATRPFVLRHHFLTNANLYLPLANLTTFQKAMLDPVGSAAAVTRVTPQLLAEGLGETQYSPALAASDPEVQALAEHFAFGNGVQVLPATIQYLNERKKFEDGFLASLAASDVPATLIWGAHDMVSPLRVAHHVWGHTLAGRASPASYWLLPCANHYLVHDQPRSLARLVRAELGAAPLAAPANLTTDACSPVLVDRH